MSLFILKIYNLFNKFEIIVDIAIPKFDKVPNLTQVLQEMPRSFVISCKPLTSNLVRSYN